ncbi:MAG: hypothetical protein A3B15_03375 [Candidatus Buchananbacteria bacterium RIFCSPLOWO2_01_FULL_45_31]|uniref:Methyltransferase domain-containing protein n=1 Tax=Candidatus Buchananbacteria bacterium RIFCSPLOWO2_01_FULL_45_31 TaxID=1797545 RepID=A0A1G1YQ79_9BACT|nr:MAG: hypothetical protein A3B15_03375 [Candidatus Buchananbacteria bacterium RIFCSPLOWO2_01_FULL_45_31]
MRFKKIKKEKNIAWWQTFGKTWMTLTAPARPPKSVIKIFEKQFLNFIKKNKRRPRVLILGCTPEYRSFCAKYRLPVIFADINPQMKKAMDMILERKNPNERFIHSDWLKIGQKIPAGSIDFVLGDFSTNNIMYADWPKLFANINKVLAPGGRFMPRDYVAKEKRMTKAEIFRKIKRTKKINYTVLWWDLIFNICYYPKTDMVRNPLLSDVAYAGNSLKVKKVIKRYIELFPPNERWWTTLTRKKLDGEYKRLFRMLAIKYVSDYPYCDITPIYILERK